MTKTTTKIDMKHKGTRNTRRIPLPALARRHERQNETAAQIILSEPGKHSAFMVTWAERFQQRRAEEQREVAAR